MPERRSTSSYGATKPFDLWEASQKGLFALAPQRQNATRPPRSISSPSVPITVTSPCTSIGPFGRSVMVTPSGVG